MARNLTTYRSCNLCEAHCGIAVTADQDTGTIKTIRGDPADSMSKGYICPKAYGLKGVYEDPDRLRKPLIKRNGSFHEASYKEALDLVAEGLLKIKTQFGANTVSTYLGNPNIHDFGSMIYHPMLQRALETKWRFSATSIDNLPKSLSTALMFGTLAPAVPDIDRTDFFLVIGANPIVSNGSLLTAPGIKHRLESLRQRGGQLIVIDPRKTETADVADEHYFIKPGGDAFFLLAILNTLFTENLISFGRLESNIHGIDAVKELSQKYPPNKISSAIGLSESEITDIARRFAGARRAVCYGRLGTTAQRLGTVTSWLIDVLNLVTSNFDEIGGAMFAKTAHESPNRQRPPAFGRWQSRVSGLPEFAGELPLAVLAEEIDTPGKDHVRALLTIAGNPLLSAPNSERLRRAITSLDFMASVDLYLNETTQYADVILPTTTSLERSNYGFVAHGQGVRNFAKRCMEAVPAQDDLLHPWQIALELGARLRNQTPEEIDEELFEQLCRSRNLDPDMSTANLSGPDRQLDAFVRGGFYSDSQSLTLSALKENPHGIDLGPLEQRLPNLLATSSAKVELAPKALLKDCEYLTKHLKTFESPFVLIGRRHLRSNNSWLHNIRSLAKGQVRCTLQIHPDDAEALGLKKGDRALVESRVGKVEVPVELTDRLMRGVVSLPHGFGHIQTGTKLEGAKKFQPGTNVNEISDDKWYDSISGNAAFNGLPVSVSAKHDPCNSETRAN